MLVQTQPEPKYVCRGCGKDWTSLPGSTIRCIVCGGVVDAVPDDPTGGYRDGFGLPGT